MKSLPIRVRLTLWYALAIAVTMFSIGCAALWMVHRAIDDLENNELQQRVRSVRRFIESRPANEPLPELREAIAAAYDVSHGNKWLQVIDERGNWIYRSPHVAAAYPNLVLPQQAPESGSYFTYTAESIPVRALIAPIAVHGVRYTVQTGLTLSKTLYTLSNFRVELFLLIAGGLLVSSMAGYFMSRKALNPIADITAEARRINDRHLDLRLPVPNTVDEISALSNTLNQMLERIDRAFASVRAFTGNASHELRTPISLLRTEIEVALHRPREAGEYRETLARLHEDAVRMTGLVENLLSLARADGGAEAMTLAPVGIATLFQRAERAWTAPMQRAMLEFHVELPGESASVLGDSQSLQRLLSILLENAAKFTPPGGSVTLSAKASGPKMAISVRDTGVGISPEDMPRIFDRFYRGAQPGDSVPRGSGLGLALAKWIADRHGAELTVESLPGTGSCFSFSLRKATLAPPTIQALSGALGKP